MQIGLIFARGTNGAFGLKNKLPWKIKEDMQHFAEATKGSAIIMGRKTWESLPPDTRPLAGRLNLVVTTHRQRYAADPVHHLYFPSDVQAAIYTAELKKASKAWLIGGAGLIAENQNRATIALVTEVEYEGKFDVEAPKLGTAWKLQDVREGDPDLMKEAGLVYRFKTYKRAL